MSGYRMTLRENLETRLAGLMLAIAPNYVVNTAVRLFHVKPHDSARNGEAANPRKGPVS